MNHSFPGPFFVAMEWFVTKPYIAPNVKRALVYPIPLWAYFGLLPSQAFSLLFFSTLPFPQPLSRNTESQPLAVRNPSASLASPPMVSSLTM